MLRLRNGVGAVGAVHADHAGDLAGILNSGGFEGRTRPLLAVGPDAAVSVLAATTIASVATGDEDYLEVMLALSLIVGAIHIGFSRPGDRLR